MRRYKKSFGALIMTLAVLISTISAGTGVTYAQEAKDVPATVESVLAGSVSGNPMFYVYFTASDWDWLQAISSVSVDGKEYDKDSYVASWGSSNAWYASQGYDYSNYRATYRLIITNDLNGSTEFLIKADGYKDATLKLDYVSYNNYSASILAASTTTSDDPKKEDDSKEESKKIPISFDQVELSSASGRWILSFKDADDYVSTIESLKINDEEWESQDYTVYTGGKYQKDDSRNQLRFVGTQWTIGGSEILKSGDVISITSSKYEDLSVKFVYDGQYANLVDDKNQGDEYKLYVKIDGAFESAIYGQKEYDAVSSATGVASSSENGAANIYVALGKGDEIPSDDDYVEVGKSENIQLDQNKTIISIDPDTEKGTSAESESGLMGYYTGVGSSFTINGTPKDPGEYLVTVSVTDTNGRTATSNAIPLTVFSGEETLAERIVVDNLTQTQDGKYMWKNMQPWAITRFGSNVEGEDETVVVPADLKAWYGSSESGLYGQLGYAIPWVDVTSGNIPQTLIIPTGCDLTFVNMEFGSSVKIVVEEGAKLSLRDSVVQGIIEVKSGATFSMNYNGFGGSGEFLTGASVDGQIILEDGAILENAAIYSHTNYIANGDVNDRTNAEPVVIANGDIIVRGQVYIEGDNAGSDPAKGQTALRVKKGKVTLEDGAVLALYGGKADVVFTADGGTALEIEDGEVTGDGKLIAVGGSGHFGNGGDAVRGTGTITAKETFLIGGTSVESRMLSGESGKPGSANPDYIKITSEYVSFNDGIMRELVSSDDPNAAVYWNAGIDATPSIDAYAVTKREVIDDNKEDVDKLKKDDSYDNKQDEEPKKDDSGLVDNGDSNSSNTGNTTGAVDNGSARVEDNQNTNSVVNTTQDSNGTNTPVRTNQGVTTPTVVTTTTPAAAIAVAAVVAPLVNTLVGNTTVGRIGGAIAAANTPANTTEDSEDVVNEDNAEEAAGAENDTNRVIRDENVPLAGDSAVESVASGNSLPIGWILFAIVVVALLVILFLVKRRKENK